jgi:hypothetical protein
LYLKSLKYRDIFVQFTWMEWRKGGISSVFFSFFRLSLETGNTFLVYFFFGFYIIIRDGKLLLKCSPLNTTRDDGIAKNKI